MGNKVIFRMSVILVMFVFSCLIGARLISWAIETSKQCEQNYIDAIKVLQGEK